MQNALTLMLVASLGLATGACRAERSAGAKERASPATEPVTAAELQALAPTLEWYADFAHASYADSAAAARALLAACNELVTAPSPESLAIAQKSWRAARHPYQQTELLRFYDGPVDRSELLINT